MIGDLIVLGIFLLIVFTCLAFGAVDPWSIALLNASVFALLLLWAAKSVIDRQITLVFPLTALPLVVLLIYGGLQSIARTDQFGRRWAISMDVEATRMALEVIGCLFILFLLTASAFANRERLSWLRSFLIFFGLGLAVFGLLQHFTWNGKYYWLIDPVIPSASPFGPFVNHNHFAGYLEMLAPVPVALILTRAARSETALLYGFAAVMMGIATVVSLSRGGMVSLLAGLMFVVFLGLRPVMFKDELTNSLRFPFFLSRIAAAAVIVIAIGVGVLWVGGDSVIRRVEKGRLTAQVAQDGSPAAGQETFYRSRGWIWRDTLGMIRANWMMGVGLGAYQTAYPIYSERDGSLLVGQAHNDYLQIMAECGVVGIATVIGFIYLVIRETLRAIRRRDPLLAGLALGAGGGVFAMLVHSLFDFNLQLPSNALLFLVLTAVVSIISRAPALEKESDVFLGRGIRVREMRREMEVWS